MESYSRIFLLFLDWKETLVPISLVEIEVDNFKEIILSQVGVNTNIIKIIKIKYHDVNFNKKSIN